MIRSLRYAARNAAALCLRALFIGYGILTGTYLLVMVNDAFNPISNYFDPISIYIPDFCRGQDPVIVYSRVIRKPITGQFVAYYDTPERDGFPLLTSGSASKLVYRPKPSRDVFPPLSEFMGRFPDLKPGRYVAVVVWTFERPWHNAATVEKVSKAFTVKDCAS